MGTALTFRHPTQRQPSRVRLLAICRGLRAWRTKKKHPGTWDALPSPGVLTMRTNRVARLNQKKIRQRVRRESDRLIGVRDQAQAGDRAKEPTSQRSLHRQPGP